MEELNWKFIIGYEEPNIHAGIQAIIQGDKKGVREVCKRYIGELKDEQTVWGKRKREYNAMQWLHKRYCDWNIECLDRDIRQYERWLVSCSTRKQKESDWFITQEMITRAKAVDARTLMDFNSAHFAHCPWHSEKTPSLKWNKKDNTVHCFGCGKHSDVIGLAMQMWGVDFKEAIKRLNK